MVVVTDAGVLPLLGGLGVVAEANRGLKVANTLVLPDDSRGTLTWARDIADALHAAEATACVAAGGGAVLDAAKVAVAALEYPWLFDHAVWKSTAGLLPWVRERKRGEGQPVLLAIPTRPGSAAQVAPRATLASAVNQTQRMVAGEGLVPDYVAVDSRSWADLGSRSVIEAVCEVLFRALGPYLVTQRCTDEQERLVSNLVAEVLEAGWSALGAEGALTPDERARIDTLSMATADPRRTVGWSPNAHPLWCVQNSLASALSVPKRVLTPGGFRAVLARERQELDPLRSPYRVASVDRGLVRESLEFLDRAVEKFPMPHHKLSSETVDEIVREIFALWKPVMTAGGWVGPPDVKQFLTHDLGFSPE